MFKNKYFLQTNISFYGVAKTVSLHIKHMVFWSFLCFNNMITPVNNSTNSDNSLKEYELFLLENPHICMCQNDECCRKTITR